MKKIRFTANFYETDVSGTSKVRFAVGKDYSLEDAEAQRCVVRGIAYEVNVADEPAAETNSVDGEEKPAEGETKPAEAEMPAADTKPAAKVKK